MKKKIFLNVYPYFFALFPILSLYSHNIDQTSIIDVLIPAIVALVTTALFVLAINLTQKSVHKSNLIVSVLIFLFFLYGHIHTFIFQKFAQNNLYRANFGLLDSFIQKDIHIHYPLLAAMIVIACLLIGWIIFSKKEFIQFSKVLTAVSIFLVVSSLFNISRYYAASDQYALVSTADKAQVVDPKDRHEKRDIYYIILDAYGRQDILNEFYGHENSQFIKFLEDKGFYVASESLSNYAWTFLSLPSSLNYSYINGLAKKVGEKSKDLRIPYQLIKKNRVSDFLRKKGYQFIHFNSTWGATLSNKFADREISYRKGFFRNEFLRILAETTLLKIFDSFIVESLAECHLYSFKMLETIPEIEGPTFAFAHFILPHYPYIFDREGNIKNNVSKLDQFKKSLWENEKAYIDQLIFVNTQIEKIVTSIISKSSRKPIIIIQSDHGPQYVRSTDADLVRGRMANLNAYYLPDGGDADLYPSITPVNSFRVVFNHYFNTDYKLLEDKSYFSPFNRPYAFTRYQGK